MSVKIRMFNNPTGSGITLVRSEKLNITNTNPGQAKNTKYCIKNYSGYNILWIRMLKGWINPVEKPVK
jgi:hypothetical protein